MSGACRTCGTGDPCICLSGVCDLDPYSLVHADLRSLCTAPSTLQMKKTEKKNLIMFVVVVGYLFYFIFLFDCICILLLFCLFCLFFRGGGVVLGFLFFFIWGILFVFVFVYFVCKKTNICHYSIYKYLSVIKQ